MSEPFISRVTGDPTFVLSRRLAGGSGFRGIAGAAVDVGYIRRFYQALELGDGSNVALLRSDGRVLVSRERAGLEAGPSPWLDALRVSGHGRCPAHDARCAARRAHARQPAARGRLPGGGRGGPQ